jgi:hypothetical protein
MSSKHVEDIMMNTNVVLKRVLFGFRQGSRGGVGLGNGDKP